MTAHVLRCYEETHKEQWTAALMINATWECDPTNINTEHWSLKEGAFSALSNWCSCMRYITFCGKWTFMKSTYITYKYWCTTGGNGIIFHVVPYSPRIYRSSEYHTHQVYLTLQPIPLHLAHHFGCVRLTHLKRSISCWHQRQCQPAAILIKYGACMVTPDARRQKSQGTSCWHDMPSTAFLWEIQF